MDTEDISFGSAPGSLPVAGALLNSVSKVHDWMNQALTGIYDTNPGPSYGGAQDFGVSTNTRIDYVSAAGMLPAAAFTARALYFNPLRVDGK